MGSIIHVNCKKCSYSNTFRLGMGIRDCKKDAVAMHFSKDDALKILDSQSWIFSFKLGRCNACKELFSVPTLTSFGESSEKQLFFEGQCKCNSSDISIIDDFDTVSVTSLSCPQCNDKLSVSEQGLWD